MQLVSKQLKISIRLPLIPTQTCINLSSLTMVPKTTKSFVVECVKRTATYDRAGTRRGEIVKSISTLYFTPFHQARFRCLESSPFQKHLTYPSPFVRAARHFCRDISANKTKYQRGSNSNWRTTKLVLLNVSSLPLAFPGTPKRFGGFKATDSSVTLKSRLLQRFLTFPAVNSRMTLKI